MNQLLEDEARTLQLGARTSRMDEEAEAEDGASADNIRRVVQNDVR